MTVEQRFREAAAAVRGAVARVEPRPLRRRRNARGFFAVLLALLTPPAGIAIVNATGDDPSTAPRIVGGVRETDAAEDRVDSADGSSVSGAGETPSPLAPDGAGSPRPDSNQLAVEERNADYTCSPEIVDDRGDIDNPAIDILEASMRYDANANTLHVREVFDDIPSPLLATDVLFYFFEFNLDGTTYYILAHHDPATQGEWVFSVQRYERTSTSDEWPYSQVRRQVAPATGRVDMQTDTVDIAVSVDEFNRGEIRQSRDEGMAPAAGPLARGDKLTRIAMTAYPRAAGPGTQDHARGCNFIVE